MAAALAAGVVSQAFINIGYVIGLLPVTGIQLPMLSAGGTSAIITLAGMGVLASVARHEPDAISAMQNYGRPAFDRVLGIGEPQAPSQSRNASQRPRRSAADPGRSAGTARPTRPVRPSRPGRTVADAEREARFGTPVTGSRSSRREPPRYDDMRRAS